MRVEKRHLKLADSAGSIREFFPIFEVQLSEDYGKVPLGGEATIGRVNIFYEPTWLARRYIGSLPSSHQR